MGTDDAVKEQPKAFIEPKEAGPAYASLNQASETICLVSSSAGTPPQSSPVRKQGDIEIDRKDKPGNEGMGPLVKSGGETGPVHDNGSGPWGGFGDVHGGTDGGINAKMPGGLKGPDAAGKGDREPKALHEGLNASLREDKGSKEEKESKGGPKVAVVVQESKDVEDGVGSRDAVDDAGSGKGMRKRMRLENRVNQGPGMLTQVAKVAKTSGKDDKRGKVIERKRQIQTPIIRKEFSVGLGKFDSGEIAVLEVLNQSNGAKVISKSGKGVIWSALMGSAVVQAGGNLNFVAVATQDGLLKVRDESSIYHLRSSI